MCTRAVLPSSPSSEYSKEYAEIVQKLSGPSRPALALPSCSSSMRASAFRSEAPSRYAVPGASAYNFTTPSSSGPTPVAGGEGWLGGEGCIGKGRSGVVGAVPPAPGRSPGAEDAVHPSAARALTRARPKARASSCIGSIVTEHRHLRLRRRRLQAPARDFGEPCRMTQQTRLATRPALLTSEGPDLSEG